MTNYDKETAVRTDCGRNPDVGFRVWSASHSGYDRGGHRWPSIAPGGGGGNRAGLRNAEPARKRQE